MLSLIARPQFYWQLSPIYFKSYAYPYSYLGGAIFFFFFFFFFLFLFLLLSVVAECPALFHCIIKEIIDIFDPLMG